jgi:hypothetical protein
MGILYTVKKKLAVVLLILKKFITVLEFGTGIPKNYTG